MKTKIKSYRTLTSLGILFMVIAAFLLVQEKDKNISLVKEQMQTAGELLMTQWKQKLSYYAMLSSLVADSKALFYGNGLKLPSQNYATFSSLLNDPYVRSIYSIDLQTKGLALTKDARLEKDFSTDAGIVQWLKNGTGPSREMRQSLFEPGATLVYTLPVFQSETVSFVGIAGLEIDAHRLFLDLQKDLIRYPGQYFMALQPDLRVLMHPEPDKRGLSLQLDPRVLQDDDGRGGQASLAGGEPSYFRMLKDPSESFQWLVVVPLSSIAQAGNAGMLKIITYLLGVLMLAISIAQGVRLFSRYQKLKKESKKMYKELLAVKAKEEEKSELIATALHETKTPLYAMTGIVRNLIERAALTQETRNSLFLLLTTGKRLTNMVSNVQDYVGKNIQRPELKISPLHIREMVDNVFHILYPTMSGKNLQLENEIPEDFPRILADNEQLEQVLLNVIGNAIKFSHQGRIQVKAVEEEKRVRIQVQDAGVGMKPEKREQINAALRSSSLNIDPDLGIGLNISKKVIHLHGGEIYLESDLDKGTCISFTLQAGKIATEN